MTLACVPSGVAVVKGVMSTTGRFESYCTPLEVRFMAEVVHAAEKMTRKQVDPIVQNLIAKYKPTQKEILMGEPFSQLYDLNSLTPKSKWMKIYEEVKAELIAMGVPFEN